MKINIDKLIRNSFILIFTLLPFSTSVEMGAVINIGFVLNVFAMPIYLVKLIKSNLQLKKNDTLLFILISLLQFWIVISLAWSDNGISALVRASYFFVSAFIFYLYFVTDNKSRYIDNLIKATNTFAIFLSAYFLLNLSFSAYEIGFFKTLTQRYVGGGMSLPWGASNIISVVLICSLVTLCLAEFLFRLRVRTMTLALVSIAIIITLSRTGSVILLLIVSLLLLSRLNLVKSLFLSLFFMVFSPILLVASFMYLSNMDFFINRYSLANLSSVNGRSEVWMYYLDLIGKDFFNLHGFYGALSENDYTPHNIFIAFFYDTGVVGFILIISLTAVLFYKIIVCVLQFSFSKEPFLFIAILFFPFLMLLNLNFEDGIYVPAVWYMFFSMVTLFIHKQGVYISR